MFLIVLSSRLEGVRILHLTDLHIDYFKLFSRNYLKNIQTIRSNIHLLKPDIVVLTGDIVEFGEGIYSLAKTTVYLQTFSITQTECFTLIETIKYQSTWLPETTSMKHYSRLPKQKYQTTLGSLAKDS